ncbi:MAG TPA: protein kinase [Gemmatales bacterium]|nr:protein kinase [Gemmatales bacterium]
MTIINQQAVQEAFEAIIRLSDAERAAWWQAHPMSEAIRREVHELLRFDAVAEREAFLEEPSHVTEADDLLGKEIGPYEVISMLGRGGMGTVYRARRSKPYVQDVALKVADLRLHSGKERFEAERQVLADLHHPGIARLLDGGVLPDDRPYLVMEYVPGVHIDVYAEKHHLKVKERAALWLQVCEAVAAAHVEGVIHRDLKPSNILVTGEGRAVVVDFGLARRWEQESGLTKTATVLGTPEYMAPEQATGGNSKTTPAADIYSLGAVFYALLTGRPPFKAESPLQLINILMRDEAVSPRRLNPAVTRDVETICLKCLEKEPGRRYGSVQQLMADVKRWQQGEAIVARPTRLTERGCRWARRRPALASMIGLLFVTIIVSFMVVWNYWRTSNKALQLAKRATTEQFLSIVELAKQPAMQRAQADFLSNWIASQEELVRSLDDEPIYLQFLRARLELAAAYDRIGQRDQAKVIAEQLFQEIEVYSRTHHSDELLIEHARFCNLYISALPNKNDLQVRGRMFQKAISILNKIPLSSPKSPEALGLIAEYRNGLAYSGLDSIDAKAELYEAHDIMARLLDPKDPQSRIRFCGCKLGLWRYYCEKGEWPQHVALLEEAVKLDRQLGQDYPERLDYRDNTRVAMLGRATVSEWRGEWQHAYDFLLEATEQNNQVQKNNPETIRFTAQSAGNYMILGQRAYALGMKDVAEKHYSLAIQLAKKGQTEMTIDYLTGMTQLLVECPVQKLRDDKLALELCNQALQLSPDDEYIWFHKGRCLLLNGQFAEAQEWLKRSLAKIKTDFELAYAHSYLALTLAKMGEYDLARKELAAAECFRTRYPKEIVMMRVYEETLKELQHQATK